MLRTLSHSTKTLKRLPVLQAHTRQTYRPTLRHPVIAQTPFEHCRRSQIEVIYGASSFHSTPSPQGLHAFLPVLFSVLKSSTALEMARTAGRIALTFVPLLALKNHRARRWLQRADERGAPAGNEGQWEEEKTIETLNIQKRTTLFRILVFFPITLFCATLMASMERTPLTGRWRLIILSPDEEEEIAAQLAGPGWYQAVGDILAQEGPVQLIPPNDWRYIWVRDTLRRLESTIPTLQKERDMDLTWLERGPNDIPLPPPAEFPLRPRPRGSEYLRRFVETVCSDRPVPPVAHTIPGPPYSLVVVDKPNAANAFSYGFGPEGGGGIVVYSGFLDNVLSRGAPDDSLKKSSSEETSWWSFLLGSFVSLTPSQVQRPAPSPEQTTDLAILLAHELAHLILSHHLETLSSGNVIVPGVLSMLSDVARAVLFPITMMFGPFVNDAVAHLGKVGSGELVKVGEYCTTMKQEIEADVVSARLLAHAGFDARRAVLFWEGQQADSNVTECSAAAVTENVETRMLSDGSLTVARRIMGSGHPVHEARVEKLKEELQRWETEKQTALRRLEEGREA